MNRNYSGRSFTARQRPHRSWARFRECARALAGRRPQGHRRHHRLVRAADRWALDPERGPPCV